MQTMRTTLLDLVRLLSDLGADEQEIVAVSIWLVNSGRVTLSGSFAERPIRDREAYV